ncbi:MAG: FMN-binding negative transcriptional regulator [Alphaproteobacteria bacterium]
MYVPRHFAESERRVLHALMRRHDFATLVAVTECGIEAAHLPFLFDEGRGSEGTLLAHVARANPLWRAFDGRSEALVVFQGPHAYISPSWYTAPANVPTWNYVAVHAYGRPRVIPEGKETRAVLERLVETHESGFERPWRMADAPEGFIDSMVPGIVAFEIPIARLEGKWKLGQNKSAADRLGAAAALRRLGEPLGLEVAAMMEAVDELR